MNTLKENIYPGRGIIIGATPDGNSAVTAYFIMGRSVNSRNRLFEATYDGIRTVAIDPTKLSDPSLIIYNPVRKLGENLIVTNGDQTDTIYDYISNGKSFEEALATRCYEPDMPNFTPRISSILSFDNNSFSYKISILKKSGENCLRIFYNYEAPVNGTGHLIHTYEGDGEPIPSFCGEPRAFSICDDIEAFTQNLWNSLDAKNRVSLYVNYTDLKTRRETVKIVNKGLNE